MSLASKITLGAAFTFTTGIIAYVHTKQTRDRKELREGVIKDLQRQNMKRTANIKAQQDQIELTKVLKAQRDVELKSQREDASKLR